MKLTKYKIEAKFNLKKENERALKIRIKNKELLNLIIRFYRKIEMIIDHLDDNEKVNNLIIIILKSYSVSFK